MSAVQFARPVDLKSLDARKLASSFVDDHAGGSLVMEGIVVMSTYRLFAQTAT